MPIDFTTTGLISSIKLRGSLPTSQPLFLDPDFISLLNEEMHGLIIPKIRSVNEEFFVTQQDVALVSGQANYTIPTRAVTGTLRDVVLLDTAGNEINLPRLEPEDIKNSNSIIGNYLYGVYLKDDQVILLPTPSDLGSITYIRFKYERRPNDLVATSAAGKITAINTGTKVVTLDNVSSDWTTDTLVDVIKPTPLFTSIADDQSVTAISSPNLTFSSIPSGLAVGQWVCEAGFSPIPQIPYEAHRVLAQAGVCLAFNSQSDTNGLTLAQNKRDEMMDDLLRSLTPRVKGSPQKITNRNGIFKYGSGRWNTRRWL